MSDEVPVEVPVMETPPVEEVKPTIEDVMKEINALKEERNKDKATIDELYKMNEALKNTNNAMAHMIPTSEKKPPYAIPTYDELENMSPSDRYKFCRQLAMDIKEGVC